VLPGDFLDDVSSSLEVIACSTENVDYGSIVKVLMRWKDAGSLNADSPFFSIDCFFRHWR